MLFSCISSKPGGLYTDCIQHCFAKNEIQLLKNKEFIYSQFYDVGGTTEVRGRWKLSNDTISLTTYEQHEDRIDSIYENKITSDSLIIIFKNDYGSVVLNDTVFADQICESKFRFQKMQVYKLNIFSCSDQLYKPISFDIKDPNSNHITIVTKEINSRIFLKDKKYVYKRNRLIEIKNSSDSTKYKHILRKLK